MPEQKEWIPQKIAKQQGYVSNQKSAVWKGGKKLLGNMLTGKIT